MENSPGMQDLRSQLDSWRPSLCATSVGLKSLAFWNRCGHYVYLLGDPEATWWRKGTAGVVCASDVRYWSGNDPLQFCCGCAFPAMPDLYAFTYRDQPDTVHVLMGSKEIGQIQLILPAEPLTLWESMVYAWNNSIYRYSVHCGGGLLGHIDRPACVSSDRALLYLDLVDGQRLPIVANQWTAGDRGNDDLVIPDAGAKLTEPQLVMYFMINVLFRVHYLTLDFDS